MYFFKCALVFTCIYFCMRVSDTLELELQIVNCHVGTGNSTLDLLKNSACT